MIAYFEKTLCNVAQRTRFLHRCILELSTLEYGYLVVVHMKEGKRQRRVGGTDEQLFPDKPPLIRCGETCSTLQ